jgi:hypothetical protein
MQSTATRMTWRDIRERVVIESVACNDVLSPAIRLTPRGRNAGERVVIESMAFNDVPSPSNQLTWREISEGFLGPWLQIAFDTDMRQ